MPEWQPSQKQSYLNFHFSYSTALSSPTALGRRSHFWVIYQFVSNCPLLCLNQINLLANQQLQFYSILADFWLKDESYNNLPLVIILASSDLNLTDKGSLDSSRQDELDGGQFISLGSIYVKLYVKTYFGQFGHYLVIYRCYTHERATI